MKRVLILIVALISGCSSFLHGQVDAIVSDSAKQNVSKRVAEINSLIKQKDYNWQAGATSISYYSEEQLKELCGEEYDISKFKEDSIAQKVMYDKYIAEDIGKKLNKTESIPDWANFMNAPENQGTCGGCWAFASTGVIEGALQHLHGTNIGLDLDESYLINNTCDGCDGGTAACAFSYVRNNKIPSEQNINSFPNYDNAYYNIISYNLAEPTSITSIKSALNNSPVYASMDVYEDFSFYQGGIYKHVSGSLRGSHAVVILGYNDNERYWICKNSWGQDWGESINEHRGYFRIAYGECGIDYRRSGSVSVNQSSLAKEVPNLISSLNDAINYSWVSNEKAYIINNSSLSGNVSLSTGKILEIASEKSLNLNSYALLLNGGSLVIQTGGSLNGLMAYLKTNSTLNGYYGSVQNAINTASSGQTVELLAQTYNYLALTISGKSNFKLIGKGADKTFIDQYEGSISITSSTNVLLSDMFVYGPISNTNSSYTVTNNLVYGEACGIYDYNGTQTKVTGILSTPGGAAFGVSCHGGSGEIRNNNISGYDAAIYLTDAADYTVGPGNNFCENTDDIVAMNGAHVYATSNKYSSQLPATIVGNVDYDHGVNGVCTSLAKTAAQENGIALIEDSGSYYPDSLKTIDEEYNSLLAQNKDNEAGLKDILLPVISKYKKFVSGSNTAKDFSLGLQKTMHAYKTFNGKEEFYSYLTELESAAKYKAYSPVINKFKIWKYADAGNYAQAVETADAVLASGIDDTELLAGTLYEKGVIIRDYLADNEGAKLSFEQLIKEYPSSPLKRFAEAQLNTVSASKGKADSAAADIKEIVNVFEAGNYPNPFNPATVIRYSIPEGGNVSLKVYDILGREVAKLVNEFQEAGTHSVEFNGSALSSGIYFYELRSGNNVMIKKMLMMK